MQKPRRDNIGSNVHLLDAVSNLRPARVSLVDPKRRRQCKLTLSIDFALLTPSRGDNADFTVPLASCFVYLSAEGVNDATCQGIAKL